jgi:hypothetical protein
MSEIPDSAMTLPKYLVRFRASINGTDSDDVGRTLAAGSLVMAQCLVCDARWRM